MKQLGIACGLEALYTVARLTAAAQGVLLSRTAFMAGQLHVLMTPLDIVKAAAVVDVAQVAPPAVHRAIVSRRPLIMAAGNGL